MSKEVDRLVKVMEQLRNPKGGCPWDLEQTSRSIASCTLEEAYEVIEAIENDDPSHLCEELGDLLLQIVFHAQMAKENGLFDLEDIAMRETEKMIDRHPHVFGDRAGVNTAGDVVTNWEADKAKKRKAKAASESRKESVLDGISTALPAMSRAIKLQDRAARVGFDWTDPREIIAKVREETDELEAEIIAGTSQEATEEELGDLFFVLVNVARRLNINPENALRRTNHKFDRRFRAIEERLGARGISMTQATLEQMEKIWSDVKKEEKKQLKK